MLLLCCFGAYCASPGAQPLLPLPRQWHCRTKPRTAPLSALVLLPACLVSVQVRLPLSSLPCTYKYGIRRADGSLALEAGENRMVALVRFW